MTDAPAELYERDFYAWTQVQARELRRLNATRPNLALDLPRLAEEIADLGKDRRDELRSWATRIIERLLLLEHYPAQDPRRHWTREVISFRREIGNRSPRPCAPTCAGGYRSCTRTRAGGWRRNSGGSARRTWSRGCRSGAPTR